MHSAAWHPLPEHAVCNTDHSCQPPVRPQHLYSPLEKNCDFSWLKRALQWNRQNKQTGLSGPQPTDGIWTLVPGPCLTVVRSADKAQKSVRSGRHSHSLGCGYNFTPYGDGDEDDHSGQRSVLLRTRHRILTQGKRHPSKGCCRTLETSELSFLQQNPKLW